MTTERPKVSIGLPVYNGEKYLSETIDCFLAQTFTDFELIVCDNASTDQTQQIVQDYAKQDSRIQYFRNSINIGATGNHNRTLELSSGEYFKWAGHDDRYAPEYLERCVEVLDNESSVVLCYPKTVIIDENGQFTKYYEDGFHLRDMKPHERFRRIVRHSNKEMFNPSLGVIRTDILKKAQPYGSFFAADRVLLAELALFGEFYEVPENLFYRRLHSNNSVRSGMTDEQVADWFDPVSKQKRVAPRFRRSLGYFKSIGRAPLTLSERVRCYLDFGGFYLSSQRLSGAMLDLVQTTKSILPASKHTS